MDNVIGALQAMKERNTTSINANSAVPFRPHRPPPNRSPLNPINQPSPHYATRFYNSGMSSSRCFYFLALIWSGRGLGSPVVPLCRQRRSHPRRGRKKEKNVRNERKNFVVFSLEPPILWLKTLFFAPSEMMATWQRAWGRVSEWSVVSEWSIIVFIV